MPHMSDKAAVTPSVALPAWYNQSKTMVTQIKYNNKPHPGATCAPSGYMSACAEV